MQNPQALVTSFIYTRVSGMGENAGGVCLEGNKMKEKWLVYWKELKKVSFIAAPMVVVTVLQYLLQVIAVMMVGHLGDKVLLSGISLASSFTNVTGISVLTGMATALETLCGQAYGAQQYQKLGIYTYTSIICLLLICFPISVIWFFMDKLLILIGQDPSISAVARTFAVFAIPCLFAYAFIPSFTRYLMAQSLTLPLMLSSLATLCFHVPICWLFVFRFKLKVLGAALSLGISYWLNVLILVLYIFFSPSCKKTRAPFSREAVSSTLCEFFRLAVPSAAMLCLEWWAYEIIILLSGLLPNPKLETSVISIGFSITYLHFYLSFGLSAAASTRVSNELGSGNSEAAKVAVKVVVAMGVFECVTISSVLVGCHNILGYAYSNDTQVVHYFASMWPLIPLSIICDSLLAIFSGIARGSGWQRVGSIVNLASYYVVGLPIAAVLAFVVHLRIKGLWIGLISGAAIQSFFLGLLVVTANWQKQAIKARERFLKETPETCSL